MNTIYPTKALSEVADVNPAFAESLPLNEMVSFIPVSAVDPESVDAVDSEVRRLSEVNKGYTPFRSGDVLVAKITPCFENGKIAQAKLTRQFGFGSTEFHVVRPHPAALDPRYLVHFLRRERVRLDGERKMTGSAGQRRVPEHFLSNYPLPLPPLPEQRRIADILDKADALRAKRRAALAQLDTLTQSIFLDMFGDPAVNPKDWECKPLPSTCHCYSGGTPSKENPEYWSGRLPWFSPKDLKKDDLFDSEDHVSEAIPATTSLRLLPRDTAVCVVRGMILAHTFPVSVLRVPATINQDLKALLPVPGVDLDPQFLAHCLRVQSASVLASVSESAHGTKRIDADALVKMRVILPPFKAQREFRSHVVRVQETLSAQANSQRGLDALFASLQHRAFRGEL